LITRAAHDCGSASSSQVALSRDLRVDCSGRTFLTYYYGIGGAKFAKKFHLVAHAVAAEMASRRVRSCTGLRRKADAPPAMACSRAFGKSWPVTMMTGSAAHFRARCACTLNPSMCGMCRSRTTQSGRRVSSDFKNSAPDPNVSTLRLTERIKRISAVRTGSSSSTTAMSGCALVTGARG